MSGFSSSLIRDFLRLCVTVRESISLTPCVSSDCSSVSVKFVLESLLSQKLSSPSSMDYDEALLLSKVIDFCICCAVLACSATSSCEHLQWIPKSLSEMAVTAFQEFSRMFFAFYSTKKSKRVGDFEIDYSLLPDDKKLVVELLPDILYLTKASIKESSIDTSDGADMGASSASVPVVYAILSAFQFRWFVTQVECPVMGKMCNLVIPCALTALDHWSPEVKGQGMISFIHLVKNVNPTDLGWYQEAMLDASCHNIASSDDIWHLVVEMSVLIATCTQKSNPRSHWFDKILNEMLGHLERQPMNKEMRVAWLKHIDPFFNGMGIMLLAHFRRIFRLLFQWIHTDDDTISLVLQRIQTIIKITWIRNSPHLERLLNELASLYKDAALKEAREEIRNHILHILLLLQASKEEWFVAAWEKHRADPDMAGLCLPLSTTNMQTGALCRILT